MSGVTIEGLVKEFGGATAVGGVDLAIADGEFVTLLGPSGCGKTTTLRCLAGLEVPTGGEISIGDRPVYSNARSVYVPPDKRSIGMVFQSYALWPHMTVAGNVGYPLKLAGVGRAETRRRVLDTLERVHLADRADELAVSLSGGQQQRVALARALSARPTVMLYDEPLSNLDAKLRQSMRAQIRELHDELGTTSVYVTHDQEEAMALADRVVVMNAGRIEQVGTPQELYTRPASAFVADFMGFQNVLPASVAEVGPDGFLAAVLGTGAALRVAGTAPGAVGAQLQVAFRSTHVRLDGAPTGGAAVVPARIRRQTYLGSSIRVLVEVDGMLVRAQVEEADFGRYGPEDLAPGRDVGLWVPPDQVVALSPGEAPAGATPATGTHTAGQPTLHQAAV